MKQLIKEALGRTLTKINSTICRNQRVEKNSVLMGKIAARQISSIDSIDRLADVEFSVFSQWGDDGIIEWLVSHFKDIPQSFIEFGVENYSESNTRFLAQNRNWRGLVIDASRANIDIIKSDAISWRHDITAVHAFITKDNINEIIDHAGFSGEIGLLSIDIDGNDYWIWNEIDKVSPYLVIVEYNANFGDVKAITVPYKSDFDRTESHFSNLYFGASVMALSLLGKRKNYTLLGSNLNGNNLFFVRDDKAAGILEAISDTDPHMSRFREARDQRGELTLTGSTLGVEAIKELPVVDIESGCECTLESIGDLFSDKWS